MFWGKLYFDAALLSHLSLTGISSETNSIACHGAPGVSNTAGAALWVIDYTLFASTIRIRELYFHEGIGYKYNFVSRCPCPGSGSI